jgi:hypothetical protein
MHNIIFLITRSRKKLLAFFTIFIAVFVILFQALAIKKLKRDNSSYKNNVDVLMSSVEKYKVIDSLNAAKTKSLELTMRDYKKYRAEDANIIKKLKADKVVNASNLKTESKIFIKTVLKDTIIYKHDTTEIEKAKRINYENKWFSISGFIKNDSAHLSILNREELIISESITRKKILFIKLPIWLFGYKSRVLNAVSKNPNTEIKNIEFIQIK